jgi:hypothetical protein
MYILQGEALGGGASMTVQRTSQKSEENGCPPPRAELGFSSSSTESPYQKCE